MKRAITAADPNPRLNFWRLILGNQLDIAALEWCKVFGSDGEPTHWKKIVPASGHVSFRTALLADLEIDEKAWADYWTAMKNYRDNQIAHHIEVPDAKYPKLELALKSSFFYYRYLIKELRKLGETRFPDEPEGYYSSFEKQVRQIARRALAATSDIEERVN